MGTTLSMCGLGPASDHADAHLEFLRGDDKMLLASERSRAQSLGTDTSVASILSNADSLIPDAFQPVDIQVLSRGRRRSAVHNNSGSTTPSKAVASHNSAHGVALLSTGINGSADDALCHR